MRGKYICRMKREKCAFLFSINYSIHTSVRIPVNGASAEMFSCSSNCFNSTATIWLTILSLKACILGLDHLSPCMRECVSLNDVGQKLWRKLTLHLKKFNDILFFAFLCKNLHVFCSTQLHVDVLVHRRSQSLRIPWSTGQNISVANENITR